MGLFADDLVNAGVGAVSDLVGGGIASLFGDDEPAAGYNKEYGTEARRLRFGSNVGRLTAMGDPTAAAYLRSNVETNPDLVNRFVNDFGADLRTGNTTAAPTSVVSAATNTSTPGSIGALSGLRNQYLQYAANNASNQANLADVLDATIHRLSTPSADLSGGYSFGDTAPSTIGGFNTPYKAILKSGATGSSTPLKIRATGSGNKYASDNVQRKTGMF